jgi:hypothetical protein
MASDNGVIILFMEMRGSLLIWKKKKSQMFKNKIINKVLRFMTDWGGGGSQDVAKWWNVVVFL